MRQERTSGDAGRLDGRLTAQRKSSMEHKLETGFAPPRADAEVAVDYPRRGERVVSREYSFRISAAENAFVEVSIDDDAWRPCRWASGYWWYDWSSYGPGPHSVLARVGLHRGRRALSVRRGFLVDA